MHQTLVALVRCESVNPAFPDSDGQAGGGAHQGEEWVDLASVETCARVLAEAVAFYCA